MGRLAEFLALASGFMPRKSFATASEDELEVTAGEASSRKRSYDESPLDARILDLDDEAESPFLRGQKRVAVRRGALPRKAASRLKIILLLLAAVACLGLVGFTLHRYATQSWRFRIDSSDNIVIAGARNVSRSQVMEVMASDIDRNIFFVPLEVSQATARSDSLGTICVAIAPPPQSAEDRHPRAGPSRFCRDQLAYPAD